MPCSQIEAALLPAFARKNIEGKVIADDDLLGSTVGVEANEEMNSEFLRCLVGCFGRKRALVIAQS